MASPTLAVPISDAELKLLQTLVYQECGMYFDERRIHFLQDRLQRRLRSTGLTTFYAYYQLLTAVKDAPNSPPCSRTLPLTRPASFAISRSWNFSRRLCWKRC